MLNLKPQRIGLRSVDDPNNAFVNEYCCIGQKRSEILALEKDQQPYFKWLLGVYLMCLLHA